MANMHSKETTNTLESSVEVKRARSGLERAEKLKRSGQKLVLDRVEELLLHDANWQQMLEQESKLRNVLHTDRLNVAKKAQSVGNFTKKLKNAYERLQKYHKDEKAHAAEFADLQRCQEHHRTRLFVRVQRELGLSDLID